MADANRIAAALRYQQGMALPTPEPDSMVGRALDAAAQWGRGVKKNVSDLVSPTAWAEALKNPPRGVLSQMNPENKQEMVRQGIDAALDFGPGALGKVAPAMLGTFIGKNAKNWNIADALKAAEMEGAGVDPQAIWKETGTWKGPDKQWRQEIPDSAARINESKPISANEWIENDIPNVPGTNPVGKVFDSKHGGALLYHPELPNAYNPLDIATNANIVGSNSLLRSERGFFDPESKNISIFGGLSADEAKSTMLHELQHAIQTKEGWAKGGNPASIAQDQAKAKARVNFLNSELLQAAKDLDRFKNGTPEYAAARETYDSAMKEKLNISPSLFQSDSYDGYRLLAGEAEARATQARRNMTAEERRAKFPAESYDVPINQLIIRQ